MAQRQSKRPVTGKVVQAGVAIELARRAGRVIRSRDVQQRAREMMPAASRLADAVRREWSGTGTPPAPKAGSGSTGRGGARDGFTR